jgi:hypothetical protein
VFGDWHNIRKLVLKYDPDEIVFSYVLNDFTDAHRIIAEAIAKKIMEF